MTAARTHSSRGAMWCAERHVPNLTRLLLCSSSHFLCGGSGFSWRRCAALDLEAWCGVCSRASASVCRPVRERSPQDALRSLGASCSLMAGSVLAMALTVSHHSRTATVRVNAPLLTSAALRQRVPEEAGVRPVPARREGHLSGHHGAVGRQRRGQSEDHGRQVRVRKVLHPQRREEVFAHTRARTHAHSWPHSACIQPQLARRGCMRARRMKRRTRKWTNCL